MHLIVLKRPDITAPAHALVNLKFGRSISSVTLIGDDVNQRRGTTSGGELAAEGRLAAGCWTTGRY